MSRLSKILISILIIGCLVCTSVQVFAAEPGNNIEEKNQIDISEILGTQNNTTNNTAENNTTNNAVNNTSTGNLPDTGVDYSVMFIIAVFAVSAVYAYKKIRDYNV